MRLMMLLLCACFWAAEFLVEPNPAQAAGTNPMTFVSNAGTDSGTCGTVATACQTLNYAIKQTANYGEIDCVNPSYYGGGFIVAQSVTIDCRNVGTTYGLITIDGAGIVVRLRNLSMDAEVGFFGIDARNMAALYVENCLIINYSPANASNPPYLGIKFEPSANAKLFVTNTIISNNGDVTGGTGGGISIAPTSGATASVTLDGVKLNGNVYGIGLNSTGGTIVGALRHSVISGSNISGLVAFGGGSPIFWTVDDSKIMNNPSFGIQTLGSGVNLQIGNSTITGNGTGVSGPGVVSFKNNQISGNATDGTPIAPVPSGLQ